MATGNVPASGPGWKVGHLQEGVQPNQSGQFVHGMTVTFTTAQGHQGSVFVPDAQLTPDNVSRAVAAKAEALDAIGNLAG